MAIERCKNLEEAASQEKHQLRLDKQELESVLRRRNEELQLKTQQIAREVEKKANAQLKQLSDQAEKLRTDLKRAEARAANLTSELGRAQSDAAQHSATVDKLRAEAAETALRAREREDVMMETNSALADKELALQLSQRQLDASLEDVEWHKKQLLHVENQLQLLESKLSRSLPVEDEEAQRRKQADECTWHQRVAALEHALASERQSVLSLKETQRTSILTEQEKATHAVAQCKAVTDELEVANLCLAERKKQREQEHAAFTEERQALQLRVASLGAEVASLQEKQAAARLEAEAREREAARVLELEHEVSEHKSATNRAETAELETRRALELLSEERDVLVQKLQVMERTTPRSASALSEARVELLRAKQKIASLEDKLAHGDSARAKDIDGRIAHLSARERKATDEQKSVACERLDATKAGSARSFRVLTD